MPLNQSHDRTDESFQIFPFRSANNSRASSRPFTSLSADLFVAQVCVGNQSIPEFIGAADNREVVGCRLDKAKDTVTHILGSSCDPPLNVSVKEVRIRELPVNRDNRAGGQRTMKWIVQSTLRGQIWGRAAPPDDGREYVY